MIARDHMQEALEEATAAAVDYRVAESQVEGRQERIGSIPDGATDASDFGYWATRQHTRIIGGLHRDILDIAARHHADCNLESCGTCDTIRNAVTTVVASLRSMAEDLTVIKNMTVPRRRGLPRWLRRAR